jgi:hypothetical protein
LKGNLHDQFLEGWAGVIPPGYSATAICLIKALTYALTVGRPAPFCRESLVQKSLTPSRLTPDFGEPDPEEAISWAQLRSRMAALINGQLLSEGEILQSQTPRVSECGGEYKDEGK